MVVAVSTERYRAICDPLKHRQAHYKYIIVVILISIGVRVPRFFEFQLVKKRNGNEENSTITLDYDTTNLSENPMYVQFNAYWNELLVTGLLPLILLVIMNFRIYQKIRASSNFAQSFDKYSGSREINKGSVRSNKISFKMKFSSIRAPNEVETGTNGNNCANMDVHSSNPAGSTNHNASDDLEITGTMLENKKID